MLSCFSGRGENFYVFCVLRKLKLIAEVKLNFIKLFRAVHAIYKIPKTYCYRLSLKYLTIRINKCIENTLFYDYCVIPQYKHFRILLALNPQLL